MLNLGPFYEVVSSWIINQKYAANIFCALAIILVLTLVCMIFLAEKIKYSRRIFIACAIITIIIFRALSLYDNIYNPDEGHHLTNSITLSHDLRPWVSTNSATTGPFTSLLILLFHSVVNLFLRPIGASLGMTYFFLSLMNIVILSTSFVVLNKLFEKKLNKNIAWSLSFFYVLFFSFSWHMDLQAFNSEYVSLFFISLSVYYLYKFMDNIKIIPLLMSGLFCGIMPFVKLQTIPLCAVLVLWGIFILLRKESIVIFKRNINKSFALIYYFGCIALPTILLVLYCLSYKDGIHNAWHYYIVDAASYVGEKSLGEYIVYFFTILLPWFLKEYWFSNIFIVSCLAFLIVFNFHVFRKQINSNWVFSCLLFLFSLLAILTPMRLFSHYILFLVIPAFLLIMESIVIINVTDYKKIEFPGFKIPQLFSKINIISFVIIFFSIFLFKTFPHNILTQTVLSSKRIIGTVNTNLTQVSKYIAQNTSYSDCIVVWGWEGRIYVFSNRKAGTAITDTSGLYFPYPSKNIDMYISDIHRNKPKYIIDVVAPGSFRLEDENIYSLEKHDRVWQAIKNDYTLIEKIPVGKGSYKIYTNDVMNIHRELTLISKINLPQNISDVSVNDINSVNINNGNLILECGTNDPHINFWLDKPINLVDYLFTTIKINCSNNIAGYFEVYYDFGDDGFSGVNSFSINIDILPQMTEIYCPISDFRGRKNLVAFRIDPPSGAIFEIESIELMGK
jgi:hypothetical protein